MVKKIVQDINIKKPKLLKFEESQEVNTLETSNSEINVPKITRPTRSRRYMSSTPTLKKRKFLPRWFVWVLIFIVIGGLVYISYAFLQKAEIGVTTRKHNFTFKDEIFTAYKQNDKKPHFEIMILNDTYAKKVNFSDPKQVSIKSNGVIFLKNEYSSKPLKIAAGTKISDDYGRLFTTDSAVTLPGFIKTKDKVVPGSVAVKVTAVSAGEEYNSTSKNFLLPSFEKTDKYTKIYGVAINPINGGALGNLYSLGPVELGTINAEANTVFKEQILRKLSAQIPDGYILYPDAVSFSYSFNQDTKSKEVLGNVDVLGTVSSIIFKKDDLQDMLVRRAGKSIPENEFPEVKIDDVSKFSLKLSEKNKPILKDVNEVSFTLNGDGVLQWEPNLSNLKQSILGVNTKDLVNILKNDPGILDAKASFTLPFQKTIPLDSSRVEIKNL